MSIHDSQTSTTISKTMSKEYIKQWMKKGRAGLLAIAVGILGSGVVIATAPKHTPQEVEEKTWPIAVMEVTPKPLSAQLKLYGKVGTAYKAELSAAIRANVTQVNVTEGQLVSKGDLLVQLDDSDALLELAEREAGVLDAKAQLASLKIQHNADLKMLNHQKELNALTQAKLERHQHLIKDNLVSAESIDDYQHKAREQAIALERQQVSVANFPHRLATAKAQLQRSNALLGKAKLNVERSRIYAPFDGAITELLVAAGDRVEVGHGLIKLYDPHHMEVRSAIPSRHLSNLRTALSKGDDIIAQTEIDGSSYPLKLTSLTAEVNIARGGVDGLFRFQKSNSALTLGQVVDLEVTLPAKPNLIAVPAQAVYDSERVYLVVDQRLVAVNITVIGEMENNSGQFRLLIQSDILKPEQLLMTSQFAAASTGLKVRF